MTPAKAPKTKSEVAALRGQYTRTYANPNGSYSLELGATRLNFKDANGAWQPIDTTLVPAAADSGWDYTEKANDKKVHISNSHPGDALAQLEVGPYSLTLRIPAALSSNGKSQEKSQAKVKTDVGDFGVDATPDGFEFSATLADASAPTTYSFAIDTGGLVATVDADGQTIDFTDPAAADPTAVVGTIGAPSLFDATDSHAPSEAVAVSLSSKEAGLRSGETMATYALDPTWIGAAERTFPVALDPSVCLQWENSGCHGGLTETATRVDNPVGQESYTLFWFSMLELDDGAAVTQATLSFEKASGDQGQTVHAWTNTAGFGSSTTWATKPSFGNPVSGATSTCAGQCAMSLDVSDIVRAWYSRGPGFMTNYGVTVKQDTASGTQLRIYGNASNYPPRLDITYYVGGYTMAFDPSLGSTYSPTTTIANGAAVLPLSVTNMSSYAWNGPASCPGDCWYVGYRWYDAKASLVTSGKAADLPSGGVASGASSALLRLSIVTPDPGQYTLRFDMVHTVNRSDVWASDWARKDKYMARAKGSSALSDTHWAGTSVIERMDYPVAVVAAGNSGNPKSVSLPDGGSLAIDLWTRAVSYDGSGGVGFADLGTNIALDYGYNSRTTGSLPGVIGASGWYTNFDERFEPGTATQDYMFRNGTQGASAVTSNADGQLTGGIGRVDRPRVTWFDENVVPVGPSGWTGGTAPTYATLASGRYSGPTVLQIPANDTGTSAPALLTPVAIADLSTAKPVNLNTYSNLLFAVKTDSAASIALGLYVTDKTTNRSNWFFYTIGANWTIGGGYYQKNITTTSPAGNWVEVGWPTLGGMNTENDVAVAFGVSANDQFTVSQIQLLGKSGATGNAYFDDIRFEGRAVGYFDTVMPTWTSQGQAATQAPDHDPAAADSFAIRVAAGDYANGPDCSNCSYNGVPWNGTGLVPFPYARWSWKKSGGRTIGITWHVVDARTSEAANITYYAGPMAPAGAPNPIQVSPTVPTDWTPVTRNILEDVRSVFGFYNSLDTSGTSTSPDSPAVGDPVSASGFRLVAGDGAYGEYDLGSLQTMPYVGGTQYGSKTGDDFIVTLQGGLTHRYNADGLLTSIVDGNGNRTTLVYDYNATASWSGIATSTARHKLTTIIAPSDGQSLAGGGGTAVRRLNVSRSPGISCGLSGAVTCVRFTEALGSGSDTGRYAEFDLNSSGDLAAVVPARRSAACAASGSSGCSGFAYDSSHNLTRVNDPRYPSPNNYYTTISWSSGAPTAIHDASTDTNRLSVVSFDTGRGNYVQVGWQDADNVVAGVVRYADLTPMGSIFREYVPADCNGNCATAYPTASSDLLVIEQADGAANLSGEIRFRTATHACAPSNYNDFLAGISACGGPTVTRRGTLAAYAVDNYTDPLVGGLTDWSQNANQFAASVTSGSADRYRTRYDYNALGQTTDTITPSLNQTSTYASQVLATPGAANYYRLSDVGDTATDAKGGVTGFFINATDKWWAPAALVNDPDRAVHFNAANAAYVLAYPAAVSGTFSVEAWFKLDAAPGSSQVLGLLGSRSSGNNSFDIKILPGGVLHGDIGNGSSWLTVGADARLPYAANNWYQVVYVVTPTGYSIYVNGTSVGAGGLYGTPMLFDANHHLSIGWTGYGNEYWQGVIDEVSIYTSALTPDQVTAHYAAAGSVVNDDAQTIYDPAGNPVQMLDNFVRNPGFESNGMAWTTAGCSIVSDHNSGIASLELVGANATASQAVALLPGQTFRLQTALKEAGSGSGKVSIDYQRLDGSWTTDWFATIDPANSAWHLRAWDVTLPMESTGQVLLTFRNVGSGAGVWLDDVAIFTSYKSSNYLTNGLTDTVTEVSGASSSNATTITKYEYGPPDQYASNLLTTNGGFASGTSGWTLTDNGSGATASISTNDAARTLRDGETSGYAISGANYGSSYNLHFPSNATGSATVSRSVAATPGTTYSASALVANTRLTGAYLSVAFTDNVGHTLAVTASPSTSLSGGPDRGSWAYQTVTATAPANATNVVVKITGQGPTIPAGGSTDGYLWVDQVRLIASATPSSYVPDVATAPAIFPTQVTRNVVSGGTAPDQNVANVTAYDRWGRAIITIDPDGIGSMKQYGANQTDLASTSDGLGNVSRTISWDAVGNPTATLSPLGTETDLSYNFGNQPVDVTSAAGTSVAQTTHTVYNAAYRPLHVYANYVSGGSGSDQNVETTTSYDGNGWVVATISDDGGINAETDKTYDFAGNVASTKVKVDGNSVHDRTTVSHFDRAGNATGSSGPIAPTASPAPHCPDSATQFCNSVSILDLNGYVIDAYDVYGHDTHTYYDIGGHALRTIVNYSAAQPFTSVYNLATDTRYDMGWRPLAVSQYLIPCNGTTSYTTLSSVPPACVYVTNTAYDAVGRSVSATRPDGYTAYTVWTKGGRTDRASAPGASGTGDSSVAWTKNGYDAAGRQTTTLADHDINGAVGILIEGFEGDSSGWDAGGSASFLSGGPAVIGLDSATPAVHDGLSGLNVTTTAASQGAEWTLPGSFATNTRYHATLWVHPASGATLTAFLGVDGGSNSSATSSGSGWQKLDIDWTPSSAPGANTVKLAIAASGATSFQVDDASVWNTAARAANKPNPANVPSSVTVFDADGRTIETLQPPALAGDPSPVTASTYDPLGHLLSVTVNAVGAVTAPTVSYSETVLAESGLVAYWRLGETSGTTADNAQGNSAIDGIFYNATLGATGAISGDADTAMGPLDGVNVEGMYVNQNAALNLGNTWTIETWIMGGSSSSGLRYIVAKGTGGYGIAMDTGNKIALVRANSSTLVETTDGLSAGWHHVVGVKAGASGHIYIDGVEVPHTTYSDATTIDNATPLTIGDDWDGGMLWNGYVDDVAIYSVALTGQQVAAHYAAAAAAPLPAGYAVTVLSDQPVAYWRLGETSGTTADNAQGNSSIDGIYYNAPLGATGAISTDDDTAMGPLDGVNVEGMYVNPYTALDLGDTWTIEAWIKGGGPSTGFRYVVAKGTGGYGIAMDEGKVALTRANSWTLEETTDPLSAGWHHVVGVKAGASGHIYVDGVEVPHTAYSDAATIDNTTPLTIGDDWDGGMLWNGYVDDVAIYSVALTQAQAAAHYAAATNPPAAPGASDTNLTTQYAYDGLGRQTSTTDPKGHVTAVANDRLGRVTQTVVDPSGLAITAKAAYDKAGEVIGTCSPNAVHAGCNPANAGDSRAWHYSYDLAGHQVTATPPANSAATAMASTTNTYDLSGAGRLSQTATGTRTTTLYYDIAGRATGGSVTVSPNTWTATNTLDSLGRATTVTSSGTSNDTLYQTYDPVGQLLTISRSSSSVNLTSFVYNPNGTASSRVDYDPSGLSHYSAFLYTATGSLRQATLPDGEGTALYTWQLDGNLASRTWGSNITGTYAYDGAKRPTSLEVKFGATTAGTLTRAYDAAGNATSETQTLTGAGSGLAASGTQTLNYDAANRLTSSYFGSSGSPIDRRVYGYDLDSNRTSVTESGVTFTYFYDATDELLSKCAGCSVWNDPSAALFTYDALGQLTTSQPNAGHDQSILRQTSYTYDPAGHLLTIDDGTPADHVAVTIDALGRHKDQTAGTSPAVTTTYAYLGTSNTISSTTSAGSVLYSAIDAIGNRLTTGTTSAFAYVLPDLHGNVVATMTNSAFSEAFRYDAYGECVDTYTPAGGIDSPWRYQGRIRESASGAPDLYDFGARSYDPSLGAFTSFDSVTGSAQNPVTLNRYLYANANPGTLVDPDGHVSLNCRYGRADCDVNQPRGTLKPKGNAWHKPLLALTPAQRADVMFGNDSDAAWHNAQVDADAAWGKLAMLNLDEPSNQILTAEEGSLGTYLVNGSGQMVSPNWKDYYYHCFPGGILTSTQVQLQASAQCQAALATSKAYNTWDLGDVPGQIGDLASSSWDLVQHPSVDVAVAAVVVVCVAGSPYCMALIIGAAGGAAYYGLQTPSDDWNADDFGMSMLTSEAVNVAGQWWLSKVSKVVNEANPANLPGWVEGPLGPDGIPTMVKAEPGAVPMPGAGAFAIAMKGVFGAGPVMGMAAATTIATTSAPIRPGDVCQIVTSWARGTLVTSIVCGLL